MAFDLPTQLGRDSDEPLCAGEVGRTGVAIDTIEDMRICFDQIPLDEVSTSMTINAPAAILLLLYELVGEEQGVPAEKLRGTVQNDVLKEYVARGNYIYPPEATMRLTTDIFEYCRKHVPKWNTISISGYHIREKGCSAVQEVAFTLSNAIAYVEAALDARPRGRRVRARGSPSSSTATTTSSRRSPSSARCAGCGRGSCASASAPQSERSQTIRFHTQTGGVTLQAQQPEVNIIRVALQGFAAVCRRHPVAPHERLRRGARAADRALGADRAANPAGARPRVGRRRHGRPASPAPTSSSRSPTRSRSGPGS